MANTNNKIVLSDGTVLIDLTADTVTASALLDGYTAHDKSGAVITGSCAFDADTSDATAVMAEILSGKSAYVNAVKLTGTMPNRGGVTGTISAKADEYTIAQGYHDGSGKVSIDTTEQAKIIAGNIKSGVQILGVTGTYSGETATAQSKTVTSARQTQTVLPDEGYDFLSSVTVEEFPTASLSVTQNGTYDAPADTAYAHLEVAVPAEAEPLYVNANGTYEAPAGSAFNPVTVDVGGFPDPQDEWTHIYYDIKEGDPGNVQLYGYAADNNNVLIEWGDGTTSRFARAKGQVHHTYREPGFYDIRITTSNETATFKLLGDANSYRGVFGAYSQNGANWNMINSARLKKIVVGKGAVIGEYFADNCRGLEEAIVRDNIAGWTAAAAGTIFSNCTALKKIELYHENTANVLCRYCAVLTDVTLGVGLTRIDSYAFQNCYSLREIVIPASVGKILNYSFYNDYFIKVHLRGVTPPILGTNAFTANAGLEIYVPEEAVETYKAAAGWSAYAAYIRGE